MFPSLKQTNTHTHTPIYSLVWPSSESIFFNIESNLDTIKVVGKVDVLDFLSDFASNTRILVPKSNYFISRWTLIMLFKNSTQLIDWKNKNGNDRHCPLWQEGDVCSYFGLHINLDFY